ncbi:LOW QUALITY PROTEIN: hypothetical protein Cgig2_016460 [Carnegiea gigantea]|uniref:SAM-dependent MTase DRM-type domain-containing protein n=1 Tax=Carnegiea gigantea TaxID=171969 RepID=A0A9Q1JI26_9CARY|nr:LOW QUALITY PROTEIN: hypothetical protein Cgig2_016460 [Carnegiea gigantea]
MIGFGVPRMMLRVSREFANEARGHPYFYYENIARTPNGVWAQITGSLYDIELKFVDSVHFSADASKRGYIRNLLIENQSPLLVIPPKTTYEALLVTRIWWPSCDKRTQLNCLLTCITSAPLIDRIREIVETWDGEPPKCHRKYVIERCNRIWFRLESTRWLCLNRMKWRCCWGSQPTTQEMFVLLGAAKPWATPFRSGIPVDTVSYYRSVLKSMFPSAMNVLFLFSGIGGAEVALYKLGILLKNRQTNQNGRIIFVDAIQSVDDSIIDGWIKDLNGFDLMIEVLVKTLLGGTEERVMALRAGTPLLSSITVEY